MKTLILTLDGTVLAFDSLDEAVRSGAYDVPRWHLRRFASCGDGLSQEELREAWTAACPQPRGVKC